jgi:hypothetical protein
MRNGYSILIVFLLLALTASVSADVVIKRQMSMEMSGMPAMSMTATEKIQGDKDYAVTEFTPPAGMGMTTDKPMSEVVITRLDKGVMWHVNSSGKTYSEMQLADLKTMMAETGTAMEDNQDSMAYTWTFDVKKQNSKTVGGIACEGAIATATGLNKTKPADTIFLYFEQWVGKDFPGKQEIDDYGKKFMDMTGVDQQGRDRMIKKLTTKFGSEFEKLGKSMNELGGYPFRTVISAKRTGTEMPDIPGMPKEEDMDAETKAAMEQMKAKMGMGTGGPQILFSVTTEVTGIETQSADKGVFEIPEGYTKQ